jgi:hypothetical protein
MPKRDGEQGAAATPETPKKVDTKTPAAAKAKAGEKVQVSVIEEKAHKLLKAAGLTGKEDEVVSKVIAKDTHKIDTAFITFKGETYDEAAEQAKNLLWWVFTEEAFEKDFTNFTIEVDKNFEDSPVVYLYKQP